MIEISFIVNLGILSGAIGLYQNDTTGVVSKTTQTSVIIAISSFVAIILYHVVVAILKIRVFKEYVARWNRNGREDQDDQQMEQPDTVVPTITQSVIALNSLSEQNEMKEPLLSSHDSTI